MVVYRDERKLVAEAKAGHHEAFESLIDACQGSVFNLARRMVGAQDAEDVAQDALIQICRSIGTFQGKSSLSTWIYRVAVNVCLAYRRRQSPEVVPFEDDYMEREMDTSSDPAEVAIKTGLRSDVNAAIDVLPEIYKDVVILHEIEGLTYRECAEVLGCPVGTVKSRLANAFCKLRDLLREHANESEFAR